MGLQRVRHDWATFTTIILKRDNILEGVSGSNSYTGATGLPVMLRGGSGCSRAGIRSGGRPSLPDSGIKLWVWGQDAVQQEVLGDQVILSSNFSWTFFLNRLCQESISSGPTACSGPGSCLWHLLASAFSPLGLVTFLHCSPYSLIFQYVPWQSISITALLESNYSGIFWGGGRFFCPQIEKDEMTGSTLYRKLNATWEKKETLKELPDYQ